ncbi:hypothetical protein G6F62_009761 [Rhizopus arrhizus]|nr:hypothetical protein G6F23_007537 [Rhizopus arrhizus]KAG1323274.1 hypothetical protein G6F62_009761 [Rhizopus arrhizus]
MNNIHYSFDPKRYPHPPVLSPPLTPSFTQPYPFDKRYSVDHSQWTQPVSQPRQSIRKQPTKQNKHNCTFPDCSWSFKRYEHLKRHMLVHTGERPHPCPYPGCGKRFSRSDNFHAHYRTHQKKEKGTRSEPVLQVNSFIYSEEKPHGCDGCEKKFKRIEHLKRHRHVHQYPCHFPGCLQSFSDLEQFTKHKKTHPFMHPSLIDFIRHEDSKVFGWHPGDDSNQNHSTESVHC